MKKIFTILSIFVLLFVTSAPQVLAIGQITEPIVIKDGLRGQEIVSTLTLLNSEKTQKIIGIVAEGQIADWANFYNKDDKDYQTPIKEIAIAAGQYLDVAVLLKIPADTANGDYVGEVSVVYNPDQATSKSDESSSTVAQKISRAVKISVSDKENISLDVSVIPNKFDYAPGEALNVRIIYDNQSNILLSPSIQFKIKQDDKTIYNVIYPYPENETAVRSMSLHEIPAINLSSDNFGTGKFLAELTFLKGDQTLTTKNFSFSIGNAGVVAGLKILSPKFLLPLGIGIVVLILIIFAVLKVKKIIKNK